MKFFMAIILAMDLLAAYVVMSDMPTMWINEAKRSKCTNPFFTKGFTVFMDGMAYELGFREDGNVVWRHPEDK